MIQDLLAVVLRDQVLLQRQGVEAEVRGAEVTEVVEAVEVTLYSILQQGLLVLHWVGFGRGQRLCLDGHRDLLVHSLVLFVELVLDEGEEVLVHPGEVLQDLDKVLVHEAAAATEDPGGLVVLDGGLHQPHPHQDLLAVCGEVLEAVVPLLTDTAGGQRFQVDRQVEVPEGGEHLALVALRQVPLEELPALEGGVGGAQAAEIEVQHPLLDDAKLRDEDPAVGEIVGVLHLALLLLRVAALQVDKPVADLAHAEGEHGLRVLVLEVLPVVGADVDEHLLQGVEVVDAHVDGGLLDAVAAAVADVQLLEPEAGCGGEVAAKLGVRLQRPAGVDVAGVAHVVGEVEQVALVNVTHQAL